MDSSPARAKSFAQTEINWDNSFRSPPKSPTPSKSLASSLASKDCVGPQSLTVMFSSTAVATGSCATYRLFFGVRLRSVFTSTPCPSTTAIGCCCYCSRPLPAPLRRSHIIHPSSLMAKMKTLDFSELSF
ncbi:hypothetical protein MRB53_015757 [Persea americana]|uniref:Uncharacterized protein n=1 Tax=Persea americana TaxID=3435 RepID=A0ACC2M0V5_PERAE|nr:hypothetical protein MRB53_015757 [Persea americana]